MKKQAGFTLVEMITVVAIIAILTVIVVANFQGAEDKTNLRLGAEEFAGVLREAKNLSVAQQRETSADPLHSNPDVGVPPGGYGIYVTTSVSTPNQYTLFADMDESGSFTLEDREYAETLNLPEGIVFDHIEFAGMENQSSAAIIFLPPSGAVKFWGIYQFGVDDSIVVTSNITYVSFFLKKADGQGMMKKVTITADTGLIEVSDVGEGLSPTPIPTLTPVFSPSIVEPTPTPSIIKPTPTPTPTKPLETPKPTVTKTKI